jgi:hypothetical protein
VWLKKPQFDEPLPNPSPTPRGAKISSFEAKIKVSKPLPHGGEVWRGVL